MAERVGFGLHLPFGIRSVSAGWGGNNRLSLDVLVEHLRGSAPARALNL